MSFEQNGNGWRILPETELDVDNQPALVFVTADSERDEGSQKHGVGPEPDLYRKSNGTCKQIEYD